MSHLTPCERCSALASNTTLNQEWTDPLAQIIIAELRRIAAMLEERLPEQSAQSERCLSRDQREVLVAEFLQKQVGATAKDIEQALRAAGYKISTTSVKRTNAWRRHQAKKKARDAEL